MYFQSIDPVIFIRWFIIKLRIAVSEIIFNFLVKLVYQIYQGPVLFLIPIAFLICFASPHSPYLW